MKQKGFSPIIILIVLVVLGFAGYWAYQKYFAPSPVASPEPSAQAVVPTSTPDVTANWKTYSNTAYNYSIKYPTNLTIGESGMGGGDIQKATAVVVYDSTNKIESPRLAVTVRFDKDTLSNIAYQHYQKVTTNLLSAADKETASKNLGYTLSDNKVGSAVTATTFGGFPAFQYSIIGSVIDDGLSEYSVPSEEHDYMWFEANQKFYLISFTKTDMMGQVLSTFKFIGENSTTLIPADASTPAASVCHTNVANYDAITLNSDTPSPKCVTIYPNQALLITNGSNQMVDIDLDGIKSTIGPNKNYNFSVDLLSRFAKGVHIMKTSLYGGGGPEILIK